MFILSEEKKKGERGNLSLVINPDKGERGAGRKRPVLGFNNKGNTAKLEKGGGEKGCLVDDNLERKRSQPKTRAHRKSVTGRKKGKREGEGKVEFNGGRGGGKKKKYPF